MSNIVHATAVSLALQPTKAVSKNFTAYFPGKSICLTAIFLLTSAQGWRPYIEREDMLIWRREEPNSGGLFAYKVYGSFDDVTAEDFLQTQIDVDYRMKWDSTARELQIIDTDPKSQTSSEDSTDVIYWETIWPVRSNRSLLSHTRNESFHL